MPNTLPFSEDCRDALQEISNVAMGAAGEALAGLVNSFVQLSIPQVSYIQGDQIDKAIASLAQDAVISAVGAPFPFGSHQIYSLVAVTDTSFDDVGKQMGWPSGSDYEQQLLLTEIAETLLNVCLPELVNQMPDALEGAAILPEVDAEVIAMHTPLAMCQWPSFSEVTGMVCVEINYHLEALDFNCDLLLLFPEHAFLTLIDQLQQLAGE